jgi:esterase/lipase superfamily enzyme
MFIKFFATNRNRENLGRNIERDKRIQLQKGGHHWLNMDEFMSHYLATTENAAFPEDVLVVDSEKEVFNGFLAKPSIKKIIVCVHGFNVELHEAHTWFNIFCSALYSSGYKNFALKDKLICDPTNPFQLQKLNDPANELVGVVGFSWPSNGNVFSYESDRTEALSARTAFANLIGRIKKYNDKAELIVVSHSMGNLLTCSMLASIVSEEFVPVEANLPSYRETFGKPGHRPFIDKYVMLAPDIERRHITQCDLVTENNGQKTRRSLYIGPYHAALEYGVGQVHNFYSRFDTALLVSNKEKFVREKIEGIKDFFTGKDDLESKYEQRLGLTEHPKAISPDNVTSHNAVIMSNRQIDHSDYQDCLPVAEKIAAIILE